MNGWFFPELGIASDEKVVAYALPKVETALAVVERTLGHGHDYLLGPELTIADFFLLPSTFAFSLTDEGKAVYPRTAKPSKLCATLEFRGDCTWTEFSFNPSDGLLALGGVAT